MRVVLIIVLTVTFLTVVLSLMVAAKRADEKMRKMTRRYFQREKEV